MNFISQTNRGSTSLTALSDVARASRPLVVLLCATLSLVGCAAKQEKAQPVVAVAVPVTVAPVVQKTVPVQVQTIGTGEAYSSVSVKSQIEGPIEKALFTEGQYIKKGDLLFLIDRRPYEADLNQAQANLARDTAQEAYASGQAERYQKLLQDGIVSKDQYDQFRSNADALGAAVQADKAAVESAKVRLSYCSISSPIDGRTGALLVHVGNVVKADDAAIVVINQVRPLYVTFSVPEQYMAEVKRFMASGKLMVEAYPPSDSARPARGVLTFVDNAVDSTTGTIKLKGTFANSDLRLWPGEFLNVVLRLSARPNATVVPSQAVQTGQSGEYVFVVTPDKTAEMRPVKTGQTIGGDTVIESGLQPGETVVTDGQLRLAPKMKVEVKAPTENLAQPASESAQ
jgi:membrane fusion protein, multidrug efflux system